MKKLFSLMLIGFTLTTSSTYAAPRTIEAFEQPDFLIKVNDDFKYHPEGLKPIVYKDRTYLPAAYVAELLGAKVYFNPSTKVVDVTISSNDQYETKIAELEKQISDLTLKLEEKKEVETTTANLKSFPVRMNKNGYELTLSDFVVTEDNDGRLYVELENKTSDLGARINVHDTILEINGQKYEPKSTFDMDVSTDFYNWIDKDKELESIIPFRNVPDKKDIKTMKITMVVSTNRITPEPETLTFDVKVN